MRLFASLVPGAAAVDHLAAAVGQVWPAHGDLHWIPRQRWHLTLAFYGEVDDREAPRLRRRLGRAAAAAHELELRFASAGHFGGRVLWVGVQGDRDGLRALAKAISADQRPYRPHLTLARARRGGDCRVAAAQLHDYAGPSWRGGELLLVRSVLGPKPRHEPMDRWPLPQAES